MSPRYRTPIVLGSFNVPTDIYGGATAVGFAATNVWLGKESSHFVLHGIILDAVPTGERVVAVQSIKMTSAGNVSNGTTILNPSLGTSAIIGFNYIGDVVIKPRRQSTLLAGEAYLNGFCVVNNNSEVNGTLIWSILP